MSDFLNRPATPSSPNTHSGTALPDAPVDASLQTFGQHVIEASQTRPVIVDFWADWCGPCKQLMPMLEDAVAKTNGAVALVKVNADQNQALCGQLHVQSLPTVLAFWQGQPVDGFQGAVPRSQLDAFIARLAGLTNDGQAGGGVPGIGEALAHADQLLANGQIEEAQDLYSRILEASPETVAAMLGLAETALLTGNTELFEPLYSELLRVELDKKLSPRLDKLKAAHELAALGDKTTDIDALKQKTEADTSDHDSWYALARGLIARGDMDGAANALLASFMRDQTWQDGAAKTLLLKLFDAKGPADPFTLKYRRRLSSILFS